MTGLWHHRVVCKIPVRWSEPVQALSVQPVGLVRRSHHKLGFVRHARVEASLQGFGGTLLTATNGTAIGSRMRGVPVSGSKRGGAHVSEAVAAEAQSTKTPEYLIAAPRDAKRRDRFENQSGT